MPIKPPRVCGCGKVFPSGQTCPCRKAKQAQYDRDRGSAAERGYDSKWRRESAAFLALPGNEFCACGCGRRANMVDHIVAHKGDMRLFWRRSNWQPFHTSCNSRKNVKFEGGFGNSVKRD